MRVQRTVSGIRLNTAAQPTTSRMSAATELPRRQSRPIGWEAVRANITPALILQGLMLAVLLAYYLSPQFASALHAVADVKRQHGIAFVVAATILAASILPEIFLIAFFQRGRIRAQNFRNLLFTAPVWAVSGISVDLL
jgi:hypothetical protein